MCLIDWIELLLFNHLKWQIVSFLFFLWIIYKKKKVNYTLAIIQIDYFIHSPDFSPNYREGILIGKTCTDPPSSLKGRFFLINWKSLMAIPSDFKLLKSIFFYSKWNIRTFGWPVWSRLRPLNCFDQQLNQRFCTGSQVSMLTVYYLHRGGCISERLALQCLYFSRSSLMIWMPLHLHGKDGVKSSLKGWLPHCWIW